MENIFFNQGGSNLGYKRGSIFGCKKQVQAYQGLIKGLFGKEMGVFVQHTKNLNQGDDCCEVVISRKTH
ncbi:MAG: hypothetical protein DRH93_20330 [Deltaproteobacteria bacterium]|nr:MAG: hypothetical protein DRH93_20330 [Deltaproteobacteria bacterium]